MLDKISQFYDLIFNKFSFETENNNLIVSTFDDVDPAYKEQAKLFIKGNKAFIVDTICNNDPSSTIMHFNLTDEKVPLSFSQEKLWFLENFEEGSYAYNVPMTFELVEKSDPEVLLESIRCIIKRHEILRTLIKNTNENIGYQQVVPPGQFSLEVSEIEVDNQLQLDEHLTSEAHRIFNLSNELPIHVSLYKLPNGPSGDCKIYLNIVAHHIAFDGWSMDIFLNDLYIFYRYNLQKKQGQDVSLPLPDRAINYRDFSLWEKAYLSDDRLDHQLQFWRDKLEGYEKLNLLTDNLRPERFKYPGKDAYFSIDERTSTSLKVLAKKLEVSLYSVLLSAYYLMLMTYTRQTDLIVGVPTANRHHRGVENIIGFFTDSLALRVKIDKDYSIAEFIKLVSKNVVDAQSHQEIPFDKLVQELSISKEASSHPIFQVIFSLQSFGNFSSSKLADILTTYESKNYSYNIAKLDMSTYMDDSGPEFLGYFNYSTTLFEASTINRFIEVYKAILKNFSLDEKIKISEINKLDKNQYNEVIYEWNSTDCGYLDNITIPELFEKQVYKTPNDTAAIYEKNILTYQQLNDRANKLAHYLKMMDVGSDVLVIVSLERSLEMLVAILAVLKAGGAYVPVSPDCPLERFQHILDETQSCIILTDTFTEDKLPSTYASVILIDEAPAVFEGYPTDNIPLMVTGDDLACVIYTSGTTGNPKGVMVEHRGIVNTLYSQRDYAELEVESDVPLHFAFLVNFTFDASISNIFLPLLFGHKLIISGKISEINVLEFITKNNINVLIIASRMLSLIGEEKNSLKTVILGGERPDSILVSSLLEAGIGVIQEYGVTEASIASTYKQVNSDAKLATIGSPLPNVKCYVLDQNLNPLPIGAVGELYLGGVGLARGYLANDGLTQEKFIANPFRTEAEESTNCNARLYKSGDLVRWNSLGELEYLGRNDCQIKLRGYRIELGEIEAALSGYQGIIQSAVALKEINDKKTLVCYYLAKHEIDENQLTMHLRSRLPDYMVPHMFVRLDNFPLTENGKLNRLKLPSPTNQEKVERVAPRTDLERQVSNIWSQLLKVETNAVGIDDNFFHLGGDSIVSIQMVGKIRQELGFTITVKDIFSSKTVSNLCEIILKNKKDVKTKPSLKTEQGVLSGEVGLLPIQAWFFDIHLSNPNYYNQAFTIKAPPMELSDLEICVTKLLAYHDVFRLRFKRDAGVINQYYDESSRVEPIKALDVSTLGEEGSAIFNAKLEEKLSMWQSNFDIEKGPLYSIGYLYGYKDKMIRIHFSMHHLIVDSVSWRIIADHLRLCFEKKPLPSKGSSYRQWVRTIKNYADSFPAEKEYWSEALKDFKGNLIEGLGCSVGEKSVAKLVLANEETKYLLKKSNESYHTEINDLLLAALSYALKKLTKSDVNFILLEGHGREEIDETIDVTKTSGWFTTMFPVRLVVKENIASTIKFTKELLRGIPNKGIGYGGIFSYKSSSLPKIGFNYLGQFGQDGSQNPSENAWEIVTNESSGTSVSSMNEDPNIISINGLVSNGCLEFGVSTKLGDEKTHLLAQSLKKSIQEIIAHTKALNRTYLSPSDIDNIISQKYLDKLQHDREVSHVYLANSLQQGFIYHALSQGDVDQSYRIQYVWHYYTEIDAAKLKKAWDCAQIKFPCLRLRFSWEDKFLQIIDTCKHINWKFVDLSDEKDATKRAFKIESLKKHDEGSRFVFDKGFLFRVYLIKQKSDHYTCIFSYHHVLFDGWSNSILINYIHDTYLRLVANEPLEVNENQSYFHAQQYLQDNSAANLKFWKKYIARSEGKKELSGLLARAASADNLKISECRYVLKHAEERICLDPKLYTSLKALSKHEGITINAILQFVWHKILRVYSNSDQTIVGATVSGRSLPVNNIEKSVGLYINTLPLIFDHVKHESKSIIDGIREIQKDINDINTNSSVNLSDLQQGSSRLFDNLFIYENYPEQESKANADKLRLSFENAMERFDYPLVLVAYEDNSEIIINLKYASEIIDSSAVSRLLSLFIILLAQISNNPSFPIKNMFYLKGNDRKKVLTSWGMSNEKYPENHTFHQCFEEIAADFPDKIALISRNEKYTYKQLNELSNQLANYLIEAYDIKAEDPIVCCLGRSEKIIIALLAIMKVGGCYVPTSPDCPIDRFKYIMKDTGSTLILCDGQSLNRLKKAVDRCEFVAIDSNVFQKKLVEQRAISPKIQSLPSHLVYIIYTSGTTGVPKGVMIEHKSFVATILGIKNKFFHKYNEINTYSMTNYVFDIFGLECGLPLVSGGLLEMGGPDSDSLDCSNFDFIQMTPSLCEIKKDKISNAANTKLFIGGEKLNHALLRQLLPIFSEVVNFYGPTETTIWSTCKSYVASSEEIMKITIGSPLADEQSYVLDENLHPLPIGGIGELYIGGSGLARGYLNNEILTREKYIEHCFQEDIEKEKAISRRLYKTGDLVKWTSDGELEYIGRNDFQIKYRGYRIELEEIEKNVSTYKFVKQNVVLVCETNTNKILVCYYTVDKDIKLDEEKLQIYLKKILPDHMVPKVYLRLSEFPLTLAGKVNRKQLPAPKFTDQENYIAPRSDIESKVCEILGNVLDISSDKIGIRDDFFRLGGNSIKATICITKINKFYKVDLKVSDIYVSRNIELISKLINNSVENAKQLIISFNDTVNQPDLYMIHPATGGCEVYTELADVLKNDFNCLGVDSYNLYNEEKITNLDDLADYYLLHIDEQKSQSSAAPYILFGWSLGGNIALKIAALLEKKGQKQIKVCLLDTVLNDDFLRSVSNKIDVELLEFYYKNHALSKGYDESFIKKIASNITVDASMMMHEIYATLSHTRIILFKPMISQSHPVLKSIEKFYDYVVTLECNNIEKIVQNSSNLKVVSVDDAHHMNVIEKRQLLASEIKLWLAAEVSGVYDIETLEDA